MLVTTILLFSYLLFLFGTTGLESTEIVFIFSRTRCRSQIFTLFGLSPGFTGYFKDLKTLKGQPESIRVSRTPSPVSGCPLQVCSFHRFWMSSSLAPTAMFS